jgi:hypothetical protein
MGPDDERGVSAGLNGGPDISGHFFDRDMTDKEWDPLPDEVNQAIQDALNTIAHQAQRFRAISDALRLP